MSDEAERSQHKKAPRVLQIRRDRLGVSGSQTGRSGSVIMNAEAAVSARLKSRAGAAITRCRWASHQTNKPSTSKNNRAVSQLSGWSAVPPCGTRYFVKWRLNHEGDC